MRRRVLFGLIGLAAGAALWRPLALFARQQTVKVTGCVERDAASSADAYKLITDVDGRPRVYQLRAPKEIDLRAAVGKVAAVSGLLTRERITGRDVDVLSIKTLDIVADKCGGRREETVDDLERWSGEGGSQPVVTPTPPSGGPNELSRKVM
jgi:hypothetical protein